MISTAEVDSARLDADTEINARLEAKPTVDEEIRVLMQHPAWASALKQRNEMVFCERQDRGHPIGLHIISKELLREMLKSGLMVTLGAHYTLTEKGREVFERVRAQH